MTTLTCMMTKNRWYKSGQTIPMTGIVVHSSGANNSQLRRYVQPTQGGAEYWELMTKIGTNQYNNHWNMASQKYGMHAFVGKLADGTVASVQTLPWDSFLWGCGSGKNGSYNSSHIQFEICEDTTDKAYTRAAYQVAVEMCAELCRKFNIDPKNIVSHFEANKKGYASNHGDPDHWWALHGLNMDGFRSAVRALLEPDDEVTAPAEPATIYRVQVGAFSKKSNADAYAARIRTDGFDCFVTKVGDLYKVQVGAFSKKGNADRQAAKLQAKGYKTFIVKA